MILLYNFSPHAYANLRLESVFPFFQLYFFFEIYATVFKYCQTGLNIYAYRHVFFFSFRHVSIRVCAGWGGGVWGFLRPSSYVKCALQCCPLASPDLIGRIWNSSVWQSENVSTEIVINYIMCLEFLIVNSLAIQICSGFIKFNWFSEPNWLLAVVLGLSSDNKCSNLFLIQAQIKLKLFLIWLYYYIFFVYSNLNVPIVG